MEAGYKQNRFDFLARAVELVSLSDYTFLRSLFVSPQMTNIELETYIDRLQIEGYNFSFMITYGNL